MSRKTKAPVAKSAVDPLVEEWQTMAEMRGELAQEAYDAQDVATQKLLDKIVNRFRVGASGTITVKGVPVTIDKKYLDYNLLYVATEILKDLAVFDIRVGTYVLPSSLCVTCGAELSDV